MTTIQRKIKEETAWVVHFHDWPEETAWIAQLNDWPAAKIKAAAIYYTNPLATVKRLRAQHPQWADDIIRCR